MVTSTGGVLQCAGPFGPPDDNNHLQAIENPPGTFGIGKVALHFWRYFEEQTGAGSWVNSDFTGARIEMRIRGVSWVANDAEFYFWLQARHISDRSKFANWAYSAFPMASYLEDGNWHVLDFHLSREAGDWHYAGGTGIYQYLDLATSLTTVHNIHLLGVYPDAGLRPTGTVQIDWIKISARSRLWSR